MSIPPDRYWVPKTVLTVAGWCGERWGRRQQNMKMWNGSFIFCSEMLQQKCRLVVFKCFKFQINCYPLVGGWSIYGLGMTRDPFFRDGWLNHQDLQCFAVHPVPGSEPQSLQLLKVVTLLLLRSVNGSVRGDFLCLKCLLAKIERWTRQGEYYRLSGSVSPSIRATRACLWCCFGLNIPRDNFGQLEQSGHKQPRLFKSTWKVKNLTFLGCSNTAHGPMLIGDS